MNNEYRIKHYRFYERGSFTMVSKTKGQYIIFSLAFCSPKDNFSKKKGVAICGNRLAGISPNAVFKLHIYQHVVLTDKIANCLSFLYLLPEWVFLSLERV